jgi:hypothetical protein
MASINVDESGHRPEPGMGLALLAVFAMIMTMAVLSALVWALMVGVAATSTSKGDAAAAPAVEAQPTSMMDQKVPPKP